MQYGNADACEEKATAIAKATPANNVFMVRFPISRLVVVVAVSGGLGALTLLPPNKALFIITIADEVTVLPRVTRVIRAVRKSESLRGKNHSHREGDTH